MNKDISNTLPLLSVAGIWTPNGATNSTTHSAVQVAIISYSQITLVNGRNGLVLNGWSFDGWDNTTFYPVSATVLEQNIDGTLTVATSNYLPDATTNGSGSVLVADFNGDGKQDIFLAGHNESPLVAKPSTAYLSNASGTFDKVTLTDHVEAHGASLASLNGIPTVFISSFDGDPNPYYQYINGQFVQTQMANYGPSFLTRQGFPNATANLSSSAVADFNSDGLPDIVIGDCSNGPGYPAAQATAPGEIVVYNLNDLMNGTGLPEIILTPYFNGKAQYANIPTAYGLGATHTFKVLTDDFNHDSKSDIVACTCLWSSTDSTQFHSMLQVFQNTTTNGVVSFVDKTDTLNSGFNVHTQEIDRSLQIIDIDHSGINAYFMAGCLWLPNNNDGTPNNSMQSNYILLNDGTGMMHVYMHDQFQTIGDQVNTYLSTIGIQNHQAGMQPRFIEYLTADNRINLTAEIQFYQTVNGNSVIQQAFINAPLQLDPTIDYTDNISITDRNGSMLMRTWAGNDVINDTNASASATSINGGLGVDTCGYSNARSQYQLAPNSNGTWGVTKSGEITDMLTNIEHLSFADTKLALDLDGNAGITAKILGAVFGAASVSNKAYVGIGLSYLDGGMSYTDLMLLALNARLGTGFSDADEVNLLYQNLADSQPSTADLSYWTGTLSAGQFTQASLAVMAADNSSNTANIDLVGLAQTGIEFTL